MSALALSHTMHILENFLVPCDFLVTITQEVCRAQEKFPNMGLVREGSSEMWDCQEREGYWCPLQILPLQHLQGRNQGMPNQ